MSKVPSNITEDVISDMYLRLQVNTIDQTLAQLSNSNLYLYQEPLVEYQQPFRPLIENDFLPGDRKVLHQQVVQRTLEIQSVLRTESGSVSIQEGAWEMVNLSIALHSLDMLEEAATIGLWTVNLFRTLVSLDSKIYLPYLVLSLRHLSKFYRNINKLDAALDAIKEGVRMCRSLQTPTASEEVKVQLAGCLVTSSTVLSAKDEHEQALRDAYAAVEVLETIFTWKLNEEHPMERGFVLREFNWDELLDTVSEMAVCEYAGALHTFSCTLVEVGLVADATKIAIKALETFRLLSPFYPNGLLQVEIAEILARLAEQEFRPFITLEEAHSYSKESEKIYRKFFEQTPKKYGKPLCNVLWEQANILGSLNREEDALKVWQEMTDMAKEIIEDHIYVARALYQLSRSFRRLKLHDQAASTRSESVRNYQVVLKTTSEIEATAYYDLAVDLHLAGRHQEAAQTAEKAISQYRTLSLQDPDQFTKKLARGLNLLGGILIHAVQYERALDEAYEAVKLHETLIQTDPSVLSEYFRALRLNLSVAELLNNSERSVERSEEIVGLYREVIKQFPDEKWRLIDATTLHSCILAMHNRLPDALRCNQEAIDWYQAHPAENNDGALRHVQCLIARGGVLDNSGHSERALEVIQQAAEVGKPYSFDSPAVASDTVGAMYHAAHLMCKLGRYDDAVVASLDVLDFARKVTLANIVDLVESLLVAAMSHTLSKKPEKAIEFMKEAIEIHQDAKMINTSKTNKYNLITLPQCILSLSEGLADTGDEAQALIHAEKAVAAALGLKAEQPALPWSAVEETYMYTILNLSIRLLANGTPSLGLDHVAEVKEFYRKRSEKRHGSYTTYATVIRTHAIFHCALGQHQEGIALRTEFMELRKHLKLIFPSLSNLVDNECNSDIARQSWASILSKLECHHQDEN
jgi:tetratricopeptide (TPR) repeat protein